MGFIDRLFVGKSVEIGIVHERRFLIGKLKTTALVAERRARLKFVLKHSAWFLLAFGISYDTYSPEEARQLRDALSRYEEALRQYEGRERGNT